MRRVAVILVVSLFLVMGIRGLYGMAAEHGGKEHGGAAMSMEPSGKNIQKAMTDYVKEKSAATGTFDVYDNETGKDRKLKLQRVHERVGKTGNYYYSCADFEDIGTGETLDLDIDVKDENGKLSVADVRIHKLNGKERYTYDENDNRIPVKK